MKCMLVFSAKMKLQKGRLYLSIGGRFDLRRSLFFLVSHSLSLWQQMVLLWTPKLPAMHCCRMLAINILMPSFSSPWLCSPRCPDTKEKSGEILPPDQAINSKNSWLKQQTELVTTDQPWLTPNSGITHWKRCRSAWINTPNMSLTCLINESPSTTSPVSKREKITMVNSVAFLFLLSVIITQA